MTDEKPAPPNGEALSEKCPFCRKGWPACVTDGFPQWRVYYCATYSVCFEAGGKVYTAQSSICKQLVEEQKHDPDN